MRTDRRILIDCEKLIEEYIKECGGCDHSVGICMCETERLLTEIRLRIGKLIECQTCMKQHEQFWCNECHGEGLVFNKDYKE